MLDGKKELDLGKGAGHHVSLPERRTNDDDDDNNNNINNNNNSNEKPKEKFGSCTRKTFDRFTTKDSYTWNITHHTESAAV